MQILKDTFSNQFSFQEVLWRLENAEAVIGLTLFGSQTKASADAVSDYDLLILISDPPVPIFQMLPYIDGRMADVVFIETSTVDQLLLQNQPISPTSFEGYFVQKMLSARIMYDPSARLQHVQEYARTQESVKQLLLPTSESDAYSIWFWLNHGLHHMKRMSQSPDAVYQTAVHVMLVGALGSICRDYHRLRDIPWEGEKAAIRHLQSHHLAFLSLLESTLSETSLNSKLTLYEQLVAQTLQPVGEIWKAGVTAVYLRNIPQSSTKLEIGLRFWQDLIGNP